MKQLLLSAHGLAIVLLGLGLVACSGGETTSGSNNSSTSSPPPSSPPSPSPAPPPGGSIGEMTITWESPTTSADQTCLRDLAGYRIVYGTSSRVYASNQTVQAGDASCVDSGIEPVLGCGNYLVCTHTVRGLSAGTWYVAAQAYDTAGAYSNHSNEIVRSVR